MVSAKPLIKKKIKKKKRISSHLDETSLVNKGLNHWPREPFSLQGQGGISRPSGKDGPNLG